MKINSSAYWGAIMAACALAHGQDATNGVAGSAARVRPGLLSEPPAHGNAIADVYDRQIGIQGPTIAMDRFGSESELGWVERENDGYALISEWNSAGRNSFQDIALSSLRETAVGLPSIENDNDAVADLFKGTVGNTDEERLGATDPVATASEIEWKQNESGHAFNYGLRLLDARPYAYDSFVWRNGRGKALLYDDMRLRYLPPGGLRVEERAIVPVTSTWQISMGGACQREHARGGKSFPGAAISLDKIGSDGRLFSIGADTEGRGFGGSAQLCFDFP